MSAPIELPVYMRVGTSAEREIGRITVRMEAPPRQANATLAALLRDVADEFEREARDGYQETS